MQSPYLQPPPKSSSQPEGEHIKEDKGKKALSSEEAKKESTDSDSDDETYVIVSMVEPSRTKKLNKFDFITEDGRHIYLIEEEINHQKKLKEDAKAKASKQEGEVRKAKLVDLLGTRMDYIHTTEAELGINLDIPLSKQDPLDKLNDLANKKRKHDDDIHDYFKANKRLKSSVKYKDHLPGTVLNEPALEIFFRLHQGPAVDDHARTFSSLFLAKIDMRNLNLPKQMRVIEQLRHLSRCSLFSDSSSGPLKIGKYLHFSVCSGTETKEGLLKLKRVVSLLEGLQGGKKIALCQKE
ncbi:hypothetical protein Tco_0757570 [Tanacetum coccineum]